MSFETSNPYQAPLAVIEATDNERISPQKARIHLILGLLSAMLGLFLWGISGIFVGIEFFWKAPDNQANQSDDLRRQIILWVVMALFGIGLVPILLGLYVTPRSRRVVCLRMILFTTFAVGLSIVLACPR